MKKILIALVVLPIMLWGAYYFVYRTNYGLFSEEFCLNVISNDVLGTPLYQPSCPRASYTDEFESSYTADKNSQAIVFKFRPIPGKESQCPPRVVLVDRRTAEVWITE